MGSRAFGCCRFKLLENHAQQGCLCKDPEIWKLIQDMKTGDDTYYTARKELWGFIKDLYQDYIKER